ncbi:hypothetical protein [Arhodomonas sp. SL1]|uniref:hypothetical protein n=1 Tax=Arhodomonas sp. SL1 TaxID=3425691 RepID=UPI003F884D3C
MKAVLHIGTEKTGTTTLQKALLDNRKALREQGVLYLAGDGLANARDLAAAALDLEAPDEYLNRSGIRGRQARSAYRDAVCAHYTDALSAPPRGIHTVVISSEHFHSRLSATASVERLREWLAPYVDAFRVVCYLRRQVDMVTSHYSTVLKGGGQLGFEAYIRRMLRTSRYYCDYARMLENWAAVFGPAAMEVRRFDREALARGSVVDDFLTCLGLGPDALAVPPSDINESVNHVGQVLLRELNRNVDPAAGAAAASNVQKVRTRIARAFAGKGEQLPPERARALQRRFDGINEAVRQRWCPDAERLFPDTYPEGDGRMLSEAQEQGLKGVAAILASSGTYSGGLQDYDPYADLLRDSADLLQQRDPVKAHGLLELAGMIRPHGGLIRRKRDKLAARLKGQGVGEESGEYSA